MKRIIYSALLLLSCRLVQAQQQKLSYHIAGSITSPLRDSVHWMILSYMADTGYVRDSVLVNNGSFSFNGTVSTLKEAQLMAVYKLLDPREGLLRSMKDNRKIYLGEGTLKVKISSTVSNADVSGSAYTSDMDLYNSYMSKFVENNENVYQRTRNVDPGERRTKRGAALKAVEDAKKHFIIAHPKNIFAIQALIDALQLYQNKKLFTSDSDSLYKELVSLYGQIDPALQQSADGRDIASRLEELSSRKLPNFSGSLLDGGTLDISKYKGRVFLIDFWGSWCVWCRKGHPHLKEIYEKFKPKGFEIIGVGVEFDKNRAVGESKLREAMDKDGITWPQIYNVNDSYNDLRKIFSIHAYPTKILVDKAGNIVLRVTDDAERKLDAKLQELLGI